MSEDTLQEKIEALFSTLNDVLKNSASLRSMKDWSDELFQLHNIPYGNVFVYDLFGEMDWQAAKQYCLENGYDVTAEGELSQNSGNDVKYYWIALDI